MDTQSIEEVEENVSAFAEKIENVQHITTKHAIINYLMTIGIVSVGGFVYRELMSMDKDGCIKKQY